jgi:hypothetical protein|tara:strand:- start:6882 stop:9062 length:2181 start_codon:yes stop_codon:yes gene_type:complete
MSKQYEADAFIKTGGTNSQYLMANGTTSTGPSGGVDVGTGTANKVAKFSDSDTITDGIMTDDGTSVLVGGNLAIGTGDNDNLFHIEATDNTYDVSRAMEIDYTKSHTGTGWSASAFGIRTNIYADGTGKNSDIQGGSFSANHIGSGVSYYLLGSQSNAKHEGSGNTGAIWGAFNQGRISGTGTGTHPFLIGTNQKAEINNANTSVGSMSGILAVVKTIAGDVTGRMDAAWLQIDGNQGSTTVVDANVLYLQADVGNITASGTMRTIHSVSTLPSFFSGTIEAPKFYIGSTESNYLEEDGSGTTKLFGDGDIMIENSDGTQIEVSDVVVVNTQVEATSFVKTGGTSSQFLKADGSVDNTSYAPATGGAYLPLAGGTMTGNLNLNYAYPRINLTDTNNDSDYSIINNDGTFSIYDATNTSHRLSISAAGNVGIGNTNPSVKLQVEGDGIFNGALVINKNAETLRLGTTATSGGTYQTWHNASGRKGFFGYGSTLNDIISLVNEENSTIQLGTNGRTADFIVSADGNIGLGITSPGVKLVTIAQNYSEGPTLGSGVVGGQALLATNGLFGQYSGVSSTTGHVWHQVQRNDATTAYNMILQPSGGNVGIGTTSPTEKLEVDGNVQAETLIATDLNDGYVPYSKSGTLGLQDSKIYTQGTGIGVGTTTLAAGCHITSLSNISATGYRVSAMQTAPSSRGDTGTLGEIRITADYIYVCHATDSWKRVGIAQW